MYLEDTSFSFFDPGTSFKSNFSQTMKIYLRKFYICRKMIQF